MDKGELAGLLATGESIKTDFKALLDLSSQHNRAEFAKDISAIANTVGGWIIVGYDEKSKEVVGVNRRDFNEEQMQQIIQSLCRPYVEFTTELVEFEGKTLGVITIPESKRKPHHVVSKAEIVTFLRRGSTTEKADSDEVIGMHEYSRSLTLEASDEFEKTSSPASTVFWVSLAGMTYAILRPMLYWLYEPNPQYSDLMTFFLMGSIVILVLFCEHITITNDLHLLGYWRWTVSIFLIILSVELVSTMIILEMTGSYHQYFRDAISVRWVGFYNLLIFSTMIGSAIFLLVEVTMPRYYARIKGISSVDKLSSSFELISPPQFKPFASILRRRKSVGIILLIIVGSILTQPIDASIGISTPRIIESPESRFNPPKFGTPFLLYIEYEEPFGTWKTQYYSLWTKTIEIAPPLLMNLFPYSIRNITTPIPSRESSTFGQGNPYLFSGQTNYFWVRAPNTTRVTGLPTNSSVDSMSINFGTYTGRTPAKINITFVKTTTIKNVQITPLPRETLTYEDGRRLHKYSFILKNNEDLRLDLGRITLSEIRDISVDQESIRLLRDGTPIGSPPSQGTFFLSSQFEPREQANITITFISK